MSDETSAALVPPLGQILSSFRAANGLTLKQFSQRVGIPVSTLSKVETGQLSLNYRRLMQISDRLNIGLARLLGGNDAAAPPPRATGWRSVARPDRLEADPTTPATTVELFTDLSRKRIAPALHRVTATSLDAFGPMLTHPYEAFMHVIEGSVELHTSFYAPALLSAGSGAYIDGSMPHAYLAKDGPSALILICLSGDEQAAHSPAHGRASQHRDA